MARPHGRGYGYDAALRLTAVTNANLEVVRYAYNAAGNLLTLTDGKNQVATWNYDIERRVTNKLDQAGVEIFRWTYDGKGRLAARWSKAKGSTAYTYDAADNLTFVNYPASPDLAFQYDPLDRLTNMVDALGASLPTRWFYAPNGRLAAEDGPWPNDAVSYAYDPAGRRTALTAQLTATYTWTQGYAWDGAGRLATATLPGSLAYGYAYTNAAGLTAAPARLALPTGAYLTNRYDAVARLLATELRNPAHTILNSHAYLVNAAHQRTRHTRTDGSHVAFEHDPVGQLKRAVGTGGSSTENLGYGYDAAWNLAVRTNGGTAYPYTNNGRNELTAAEGATFSHDFNGNRTQRAVSSGYVTYVYDDENQLIEAATDTAYTPMSGRWKVTFTYDGLGRLKVKQPHFWSGSGYWQPETATRYVYDGRRVIQERHGGNVPVVAYGRGPDLSGTLEGAGGIGGLLGRSDQYQSGSGVFNRTVSYHADGGGNVTALVDAGHALLAQYRYDPYGRQTWSTGTLKDANLYRFSSKEFVPNLGFYYYGFRFYDPQTQRWVNRDPILEEGGINLYGFVGNRPTVAYDPDGRVAPLVAMAAGIAVGIAIDYALDYIRDQHVPDEYQDLYDKARDVYDYSNPKGWGKKGLRCLGAARLRKLKPDTDADGPHTTWKTDPQTGEITRHETWTPNPQNPRGWDSVQSTDLRGRPHRNSETGQPIPTPHTQGPNIPGGVRPALPSEIPK